MFRHPVPRLSRHFLPANSLNPQTRIGANTCIRPLILIRSKCGAGLRSHCDKHDDVPHLDFTIVNPIAKLPKFASTIADPQILVALNALTGGRPEINNDCRPSTARSRQNNIGDSFESHTASLLDGLATICVHGPGPGGQVLALGMQIDHVSSKIRLTIAGNHNVPENTVQNLEALWNILRDISLHHVERSRICGKESGKKKKKKKKKKSMETPHSSEEEPALLRRLQHTVYQLTSKILLSRLHRLEFTKFVIAFKKTTHGPCPVEEHRAAEILIGVANVIENTLMPLLQKLKLNSDLGESEWRTIFIMMDGVLHDCEHILDDEGFCEKWVIKANNVDKTISASFTLRGYLEKITLLHSHIYALVRSAQSLHSTFVKELSIHSIPAERGKLHLPETPQILEALVISVAHQQGYAITNTAFIQQTEHYASTKSKVHCECLLVKYFHTLKNAAKLNSSSWNNISPFSYIGVSKLSCQACGSWLKAYGSLGQQSFVTKGIHQKWSRSWGMPQLLNRKEMEQVQEDMARDTARKFCLYQEERGMMVPLPDITAAGAPLIKDNGEATIYAAAKIKGRQADYM